MSKPTTKPDAPEAGVELTDEQLRGVSGGNSIDKVPNIRTPKFGPAASISQGEVTAIRPTTTCPETAANHRGWLPRRHIDQTATGN